MNPSVVSNTCDFTSTLYRRRMVERTEIISIYAKLRRLESAGKGDGRSLLLTDLVQAIRSALAVKE